MQTQAARLLAFTVLKRACAVLSTLFSHCLINACFGFSAQTSFSLLQLLFQHMARHQPLTVDMILASVSSSTPGKHAHPDAFYV